MLNRTNRHEITAYGHLHGQDNKKILRKSSSEEVLVLEKGKMMEYAHPHKLIKEGEETGEGYFYKMLEAC